MKQDSIENLVRALVNAFDETRKPRPLKNGLEIVLVETETYKLTFEASLTSEVDRTAALFYEFPQIALNPSKSNAKMLKKINKKFFKPKGFELVILRGNEGLSEPVLMYELKGTEDAEELKRLHGQFLMLAMFAWQTVGEFVG